MLKLKLMLTQPPTELELELGLSLAIQSEDNHASKNIKYEVVFVLSKCNGKLSQIRNCTINCYIHTLFYKSSKNLFNNEKEFRQKVCKW